MALCCGIVPGAVVTEHTLHRHTLRSLTADYTRAGGGLLLTALPLITVDTTVTVAWMLGAGAFLFAVYGFNTVMRHLGIVECNETAISVSGPIKRAVAWSEVSDVRLRYFSTRRDGRKGWMQLVVKSPTASVRIESTLVGFADIVALAVKAAKKRGIDLSPTTLGNVEVLRVKTGLFTSGNGSPCRIS
jgi:hypothetical protein